MIYRKHRKAVKGFVTKSERTWAVDLDIVGQRFRIIAAYLLDGSYDDDAVEATYSKLNQLYNDAEARQGQVIRNGNLNAMNGRSRSDEPDCIGPP